MGKNDSHFKFVYFCLNREIYYPFRRKENISLGSITERMNRRKKKRFDGISINGKLALYRKVRLSSVS